MVKNFARGGRNGRIAIVTQTNAAQTIEESTALETDDATDKARKTPVFIQAGNANEHQRHTASPAHEGFAHVGAANTAHHFEILEVFGLEAHSPHHARPVAQNHAVLIADHQTFEPSQQGVVLLQLVIQPGGIV